ncbi:MULTISPECIES: DUF4224 domain-containing protein [unclassified Caballeronia]|uniref:DUF4224 domain-containing protein n=1 Tax=unclassified Caballeronia TaxID=2646786 RepID=UPI00285515F2|nr:MULTISPECIES: DUF4224 domain-containing protein [unclassified Caballeronia]MDR5772111.1 DUF4224 domain-containing protein [Caballeronia sp. LZ002]MDR5847545.1 DUF4224 domain-containing protein [Caballeronia sp. LZ003]
MSLMTEDELVQITGKRRRNKQAEWFKLTFGVDVVRSADGRLIVTWQTFEALSARKNGLGTAAPAVVELDFS